MAVVSAEHLTKRFGAVVAVDDVNFTVGPGRVTGFLGPNGAGKTTTLRLLLGLVSPTSGTARIDGVDYRRLPRPTQSVGAVLESSGFHPARSAWNHLRAVAQVAGVADAKVAEVLDTVGLTADRHRPVGGYSMGMRQRLELARALLGDPQVLVLDEPANGLDPQGIAWLRSFLRWYAGEQKVVLVSSHLLAEAAQTVDDVVILASGRLAAQGRLDDLLESARAASVSVRTPEAVRLIEVASAAGLRPERVGEDKVVLGGARPEQVGPLLAEHRIVIYEMTSHAESLEDLFFALTEGSGPAARPFRGGP